MKLFMKNIILLILLILLVLTTPLPASGAELDITDRFTALLNHPEGWEGWGKGIFDDGSLVYGLSEIYEDSLAGGSDIPLVYVIYAMGETGLQDFMPLLLDSLDDEPVAVCFALRNIPTETAVQTLMDLLEHENMHVRDTAAYCLGKYTHYELFDGLSDIVIPTLNSRLETEDEDWIREDIRAAIVYIESGIAINAAFQETVLPPEE